MERTISAMPMMPTQWASQSRSDSQYSVSWPHPTPVSGSARKGQGQQGRHQHGQGPKGSSHAGHVLIGGLVAG